MDSVFSFGELGFQEVETSKYLTGVLEKNGFTSCYVRPIAWRGSEQMGVAESEISRETSFVNDLNADSLDTVELVMEFEEEFELNIPDEQAEKIQTVGQAIDKVSDAQVRRQFVDVQLNFGR